MILVSKTIEDRADIDPAYQDAEGEPDSQVPNKFPSSPVVKPVGIRQADGTVKPYVSPTSSFALVSTFAFESTDYQALTSFAVATDESRFARQHPIIPARSNLCQRKA